MATPYYCAGCHLPLEAVTVVEQRTGQIWPFGPSEKQKRKSKEDEKYKLQVTKAQEFFGSFNKLYTDLRGSIMRDPREPVWDPDVIVPWDMKKVKTGKEKAFLDILTEPAARNPTIWLRRGEPGPEGGKRTPGAERPVYGLITRWEPFLRGMIRDAGNRVDVEIFKTFVSWAGPNLSHDYIFKLALQEENFIVAKVYMGSPVSQSRSRHINALFDKVSNFLIWKQFDIKECQRVLNWMFFDGAVSEDTPPASKVEPDDVLNKLFDDCPWGAVPDGPVGKTAVLQTIFIKHKRFAPIIYNLIKCLGQYTVVEHAPHVKEILSLMLTHDPNIKEYCSAVAEGIDGYIRFARDVDLVLRPWADGSLRYKNADGYAYHGKWNSPARELYDVVKDTLSKV